MSKHGAGIGQVEGSCKVRGPGRPRHMMQIIVAIAREIFDESAYTRFLSRSKMRSCPEAYAAFQRECEAMKARRPKCC